MSIRFEVRGPFILDPGWKVLKITSSTRKGRKYTHTKRVAVRQTKEEAEAIAKSMTLGAAGLLRRYVLGRRMKHG
jgi:hypothetical protein